MINVNEAEQIKRAPELHYPIVNVMTQDGFRLEGSYYPAVHSEIAVIHAHGTGGRHTYNSFHEPIATAITQQGISYITGDNRGSGVYELEKGFPPSGVSLEIFEGCLADLDAWIEFAKEQGAKRIILEGHSFGIGKVTYYMAKGKYKEMVDGVIFLGTNGVFQTQQDYLANKQESWEGYLAEAKKLIDEGRPTQLLHDPLALAGYYPCSAQTYVNFFGPNSNVFRTTQMARKEKGGLRHLITKPLLWILGDAPAREYLFTSFPKAFELVKEENPQVEIHQLRNCDHGLNRHENEVSVIIARFVQKLYT